MNQSEINAEWHQQLDSNVGKIGMLVQPRHVTPGLRKPYEWELEWDMLEALVLALRGIANSRTKWLQCALVEAKRLAFGRRVKIFLLGYRPGFCGPTEAEGITADQWQLTGDAVRLALKVLPDAKPYIEEWSAEKKFQLRFEAYIMEKK